MRVGHLIEHDQRPAIGGARQLVPIRLRQRLGFECHALMHRVGTEKAVQVAWGHAVDFRGYGADGLDQPAFGIFRQHEAMNAPLRVLQRRFDGVQAEEYERPFGVLSG